MIRSRKTRSGFTLVELMISAAITVMIMTILSICFQVSMKAMSAMRAQGDAADQLRAVGEVIKRDVNASHFSPVDPGTGPRNVGRRLSDYQNVTPRSGFFFLSSPDSASEGNDGVFTSTRNVSCALWMTSVLAGGSEGSLFTATIGGNAVSSEAAEVAYFLSAMPGEFTAPGLNGTQNQRFNLHRRQRLVASDLNKQIQFNSLLSDPNPVIRAQAQTYISANLLNAAQSHLMTSFNAATRPTFPTPIGTGDDIILSNVISFEIKPTWLWTGAGPVRSPRAFATNTDSPYDNLQTPVGTTTFDTLGGGTTQMRINAVQLRIRIYDPKAKTARQSTFVFDL
ncbi:MAG: type II secretion system protein [Gemmataceae bacterium]